MIESKELAQSYPEHEKFRLVKHEIEEVSRFIRWLQNKKGVQVFRRFAGDLERNAAQLAAEFYEIDEEEFLNEKDRMLEDMRLTSKRLEDYARGRHPDPKA